ncbi:hypothetical protein GDO86_006052 [Hymenochirus boettgeri]|uniref:Uncharacterized protein n=1 Tax=Hymenochirus boettgeri TaxID=247094 RepID=A0A8T2J8Q5_9PIPI|nr:hypothetical protein GDO86_006052 [Hymenochirus boettgeri]
MLGWILRGSARCPGPSTRLSLFAGHFLQMCKASSTPSITAVTKTVVSQPKAQASTQSFPSQNIKKFSSSVFLYTDPSVPWNCRSSRPLLLLLPWLGSKARFYEQYIRLYFKLGFDVLVAESSTSHFLWPQKGLDYARELLDLLLTEKELAFRSLYVHGISIGGYMFSQMLVSSSSSHKEHQEMLRKIQGQVYDSLVVGSMETMATGVAQMYFSPGLRWIVTRGVLLYFALFKAQTADNYEKAIQTFWNNPITCPALFFYCLDDPLSDHTLVDKLLKTWEKQGIQVKSKKWIHSLHAGHLRRHPQEYIETLNEFFHSLQKHTPKCKL